MFASLVGGISVQRALLGPQGPELWTGERGSGGRSERWDGQGAWRQVRVGPLVPVQLTWAGHSSLRQPRSTTLQLSHSGRLHWTAGAGTHVVFGAQLAFPAAAPGGGSGVCRTGSSSG